MPPIPGVRAGLKRSRVPLTCGLAALRGVGLSWWVSRPHWPPDVVKRHPVVGEEHFPASGQAPLELGATPPWLSRVTQSWGSGAILPFALAIALFAYFVPFSRD